MSIFDWMALFSFVAVLLGLVWLGRWKWKKWVEEEQQLVRIADTAPPAVFKKLSERLGLTEAELRERAESARRFLKATKNEALP